MNKGLSHLYVPTQFPIWHLGKSPEQGALFAHLHAPEMQVSEAFKQGALFPHLHTPEVHVSEEPGQSEAPLQTTRSVSFKQSHYLIYITYFIFYIITFNHITTMFKKSLKKEVILNAQTPPNCDDGVVLDGLISLLKEIHLI